MPVPTSPVIPDVLPEPETVSLGEPDAQILLESTFVEDISQDGLAPNENTDATTSEAIPQEESLLPGKRSFTEKRKWQIASDATGSMLLYWASSTIPSGWTCVSCLPGDVFYQRFVIGSSTPGVNGGAATHTHTATGATEPVTIVRTQL